MIREVGEVQETTARLQVQGLMNRMLTAPKAKGWDDVRILYVDGEDKAALTAFLRRHGEERGRPGLVRDAANVDRAVAVVVLGARPMFMNLDCGMCGQETCQRAEAARVNCIYPIADLGIAVGSGVSAAAEMGLDNRVMYSIGLAALKTGLFGDPGIRCALGIPFSVSSKNVFFDRR
ncbi:MAG TPA: DUF2148 domain-containing protein [Anaeromyxobacter sp.]|nr:DUF2148 domain-containing protein [Anaeromyxobacter sp.]